MAAAFQAIPDQFPIDQVAIAVLLKLRLGPKVSYKSLYQSAKKFDKITRLFKNAVRMWPGLGQGFAGKAFVQLLRDHP